MPTLLRRTAEELERRVAVEVQGHFETEVNEHGPWPSMTVYFHRPDTHRNEPAS